MELRLDNFADQDISSNFEQQYFIVPYQFGKTSNFFRQIWNGYKDLELKSKLQKGGFWLGSGIGIVTKMQKFSLYKVIFEAERHTFASQLWEARKEGCL